ncbi:serine O-acetyltransferase [Marinicellulosiphila megalodicopiae]|uniref:serine O-acetyltransferase n=1 Tax=Marinicellulosiphila megalodicopiae TaxID=2724896 RepID=UPI003BAEFCDC
MKDSFFSEIQQDLIANGWIKGKFGMLLRMLILDLGIHMLIHYRIRHKLNNFYFIGRFLSRIIGYFSQVITGADISASAKLYGGIEIPHTNGIVIGREAIVHSGVAIYQQVTLGADKNFKFPVIKTGVTLYAGAKIIGDVVVGENSIVGANSVVVKNVEPNTIVAGVPAKVIRLNSEKEIS